MPIRHSHHRQQLSLARNHHHWLLLLRQLLLLLRTQKWRLYSVNHSWINHKCIWCNSSNINNSRIVTCKCTNSAGAGVALIPIKWSCPLRNPLDRSTGKPSTTRNRSGKQRTRLNRSNSRGFHLRTERLMKARGFTDKNQEKARNYGQTVLVIKARGCVGKRKAPADYPIGVVITTAVNLISTKLPVKVQELER